MNERRAHVLELVTALHIDSARPVASGPIAEQLGVSSATVRNDFCALEDAGYLQQPHTSAGRVPTSLAFEQYANKFIPPGRLSKRQRRRLSERLRRSHGERLLQQIADIAAELSGYAVVVSLPADDSVRALEVHLSVISSKRLLAVVVLENGLIRQVSVELDPAPDDGTLRDAESSLRTLALPIGELSEGLSDIATRTPDDLSRTLNALADALSTISPPRIFSQGLRHLLTEPEAGDPDFIRTAIERVENPTFADSDLVIVLDDALANVTARLPFGSSPGGLMIVGPVRMRYKEALTVANGLTELVGEQLN